MIDYEDYQKRFERQRRDVMDQARRDRIDKGEMVVVELPRDVNTPAALYRAGVPLCVHAATADMLCNTYGAKVLEDKRHAKGRTAPRRETAVKPKAETPEDKA